MTFENEILNISGDSDSGYMTSQKNPFKGIKFNLYKTETQKADFIFVTNCCPTDICEYTKIFSKSENNFSTKSEIEGEVVSYDSEGYKVIDNSVTGLVFLFSNPTNEIISIFNKHNISIPESNNRRSLTVLEKKEINLLKKPNPPNLDNLNRRVFLSPKQKIFILHETLDEKYYFIFFPADKKSIEDILNIFEDEAESYITKIQALKNKIKNKNDLKKLLEKKYFHFGWVEKKDFE